MLFVRFFFLYDIFFSRKNCVSVNTWEWEIVYPHEGGCIMEKSWAFPNISPSIDIAFYIVWIHLHLNRICRKRELWLMLPCDLTSISLFLKMSWWQYCLQFPLEMRKEKGFCENGYKICSFYLKYSVIDTIYHESRIYNTYIA